MLCLKGIRDSQVEMPSNQLNMWVYRSEYRRGLKIQICWSSAVNKWSVNITHGVERIKNKISNSDVKKHHI